MKKLFASLLSSLLICCSYSQETAIEKEITVLEEKIIQAILQKDSAFLRTTWAGDFMVNSPRNTVASGGQVDRVMDGTIAYTSYTYAPEKILVKGEIVISMGNETVVPVMGNPNGGKTLQRRYTHIWTKNDGRWLLIARHANIVCMQ